MGGSFCRYGFYRRNADAGWGMYQAVGDYAMIDINKQYRTRDGREVRIYAINEGCGVASVHGAIKCKDDVWHVYSWSEDGISIFGQITDKDLIEVRPRHKRTVWLNVYDHCLSYYDNKEDADMFAGGRRIACIKVDLDFFEGDGL